MLIHCWHVHILCTYCPLVYRGIAPWSAAVLQPLTSISSYKQLLGPVMGSYTIIMRTMAPLFASAAPTSSLVSVDACVLVSRRGKLLCSAPGQTSTQLHAV